VNDPHITVNIVFVIHYFCWLWVSDFVVSPHFGHSEARSRPTRPTFLGPSKHDACDFCFHSQDGSSIHNLLYCRWLLKFYF